MRPERSRTGPAETTTVLHTSNTKVDRRRMLSSELRSVWREVLLNLGQSKAGRRSECEVKRKK